jgi:hypothetical protein
VARQMNGRGWISSRRPARIRAVEGSSRLSARGFLAARDLGADGEMATVGGHQQASGGEEDGGEKKRRSETYARPCAEDPETWVMSDPQRLAALVTLRRAPCTSPFRPSGADAESSSLASAYARAMERPLGTSCLGRLKRS